MKRAMFHDSSPGSPSGSSKQKKRRKKKDSKPKSNEKSKFLDSIPLPLSNKFTSLDDEMDGESSSSAQKAKENKISPIVVTNFDLDIHKFTSTLGLSDQCEIKLVSVGRKIFVKSFADKQKIINACTHQQIDYFTHPDSENKTFKAVLTGLPEIPTQEIIDSLKSLHDITATKVIMFNTNSKSKLYLCHFLKSEVNMKVLASITKCYHHIVKWQPYKPKRRGPTQCYRCMLYGHGISQCMRYAVCSLCSGNHLTNTCTNITKDTTNPVYKCYNCASAKLPAHTHKATDPICPYRAKYEQTMKNARDKKRQTSPSNINNNSNNNNIIDANRSAQAPNPPIAHASYADAAKTSRTRTQSQTQSSSSRTQERQSHQTHTSDSTNENVWSIAEVANLLLNSINELKACKTKLDQLKIIANLLQNACV